VESHNRISAPDKRPKRFSKNMQRQRVTHKKWVTNCFMYITSSLFMYALFLGIPFVLNVLWVMVPMQHHTMDYCCPVRPFNWTQKVYPYVNDSINHEYTSIENVDMMNDIVLDHIMINNVTIDKSDNKVAFGFTYVLYFSWTLFIWYMLFELVIPGCHIIFLIIGAIGYLAVAISFTILLFKMKWKSKNVLLVYALIETTFNVLAYLLYVAWLRLKTLLWKWNKPFRPCSWAKPVANFVYCDPLWRVFRKHDQLMSEEKHFDPTLKEYLANMITDSDDFTEEEILHLSEKRADNAEPCRNPELDECSDGTEIQPPETLPMFIKLIKLVLFKWLLVALWSYLQVFATIWNSGLKQHEKFLLTIVFRASQIIITNVGELITDALIPQDVAEVRYIPKFMYVSHI
jgi:hypothetical protein